MKKIGIIGSRRRDSQQDYLDVESILETILYKEGDWIVSGGCPKGGDRFAKELSKKFSIPYLEFPANWQRFGRGAGFKRNTDIAEHSDVLIVCLEDFSGGAFDTLKKALKLNKRCVVIYTDKEDAEYPRKIRVMWDIKDLPS